MGWLGKGAGLVFVDDVFGEQSRSNGRRVLPRACLPTQNQSNCFPTLNQSNGTLANPLTQNPWAPFSIGRHFVRGDPVRNTMLSLRLKAAPVYATRPFGE